VAAARQTKLTGGGVKIKSAAAAVF